MRFDVAVWVWVVMCMGGYVCGGYGCSVVVVMGEV